MNHYCIKQLLLCWLALIATTSFLVAENNIPCNELHKLKTANLEALPLDSLNHIADQLQADYTCKKEWLSAAAQLGYAFKSQGEYAQLETFCTAVLKLTAPSKDTLYQEINFLLNEAYVYIGAFDKGIPLALNLLSYYQQLGNITKEYQLRKRLMYYYSNTSNTNECIAFGLETRTWMDKYVPNENQAGIINYMASSYITLRDYSKTKQLVKEAIAMNPPLNILSDLKTKELVSLYEENHVDSAQQLLQEMIAHYKEDEGTNKFTLLFNLAAVTYNNDDFKSTVALISNIESPKELSKLREDEKMSIYALKGSSMIASKRYSEGLQYLYLALPVAQKLGDNGTLLVMYERMATAYIYLSVPDSASRYNLLALKIKESLFNQSKAEALEAAEHNYEKQLNEKTIELQQTEIETQKRLNKQQSIIIALATVGLLVVIILAVMLFRSNQTKQKNLQLAIAQKAQIAKQSEERELLLKEIHHRVKNNLQIISNLLELQAMKSEGDASAVLLDGQLRVQSMAMIHQKLYQQDNVAELDFKEYLTQMQGHWKSTFEAEKLATLALDCENIFLDIDTAIPLGLIINELITNAYKHAFKGIEQPAISISMRQINAGNYELKVQDNGVGFDKDLSKLKSLGMRLVQRLSKQISGDLTIESVQGALFTIQFKNSTMRQLIE